MYVMEMDLYTMKQALTRNYRHCDTWNAQLCGIEV